MRSAIFTMAAVIFASTAGFGQDSNYITQFEKEHHQRYAQLWNSFQAYCDNKTEENRTILMDDLGVSDKGSVGFLVGNITGESYQWDGEIYISKPDGSRPYKNRTTPEILVICDGDFSMRHGRDWSGKTILVDGVIKIWARGLQCNMPNLFEVDESSIVMAQSFMTMGTGQEINKAMVWVRRKSVMAFKEVNPNANIILMGYVGFGDGMILQLP